MVLRIGGVDFPAAPFNGWYMGTEIGSRDLGDTGRYDCLPVIADRMGLDRSRDSSLWKDRALVELNAAVLHSYSQAGVRIVDHHRASSEFMDFVDHEKKAGRLVSADWSWIVPPMSGSATPVFHKGWKDRTLLPDYQLQPKAWVHF
jgi:nitric-oxide synthase